MSAIDLETRTVAVAGGIRVLRVLMAAAPFRVSTLPDGSLAATAHTPVVIPDDLEVHRMQRWVYRLLHTIGYCTPGRVTLLDTDGGVFTVEEIVHELVHDVDRRWMEAVHRHRWVGRLHYRLTYAWHFVLNVLAHGRRWHEFHGMEHRARVIAKKLAALLTTATETQPFDVAALIRAEMPTHFPAAA